ncbi:hypothetical protein E1301_Tti011150 [Triplophysa tibetana]|uniref:Uncharacterized protein n=1 Tax=Triplophysa tibetana TaxID=1572043 RepID=A0A5A9NP78_9TELE|nr:hypothetical protein E1301_Tti011150 [Triplophysa tibetana]
MSLLWITDVLGADGKEGIRETDCQQINSQGLRRVGSGERTRPGPVPQCLRDPTRTRMAPLASRMNRGLQTSVH